MKLTTKTIFWQESFWPCRISIKPEDPKHDSYTYLKKWSGNIVVWRHGKLWIDLTKNNIVIDNISVGSIRRERKTQRIFDTGNLIIDTGHGKIEAVEAQRLEFMNIDYAIMQSDKKIGDVIVKTSLFNIIEQKEIVILDEKLSWACILLSLFLTNKGDTAADGGD